MYYRINYIDIILLYVHRVYILYIYIYIYIYILKKITNNRIYEKVSRSDLSTQINKTSPLTNYLLRITFSCYLFVLCNFVRFFYDFFFLGIGFN